MGTTEPQPEGVVSGTMTTQDVNPATDPGPAPIALEPTDGGTTTETATVTEVPADAPAEDTTPDPVPTTVLGIPPGTTAGEAQAIVDERARQAMVGDVNMAPLEVADPEADCTCADIGDGMKAGDPRCPAHGELVMNRIGGMANRDARLGPLVTYFPYLNGALVKVPADDPIYQRETAAA